MKKSFGLIAITLLVTQSYGSIESAKVDRFAKIQSYKKRAMICLSNLVKKKDSPGSYKEIDQVLLTLSKIDGMDKKSLVAYRSVISDCRNLSYDAHKTSKNKQNPNAIKIKIDSYKASTKKIKSLMMALANENLYHCEEGLTKKSSLKIYQSQLMTCSNSIGKSFAFSKGTMKSHLLKEVEIRDYDQINLVAKVSFNGQQDKSIKEIEIHPLKFDQSKFENLL